MGRFINADVYTSTGQDLLGNNMFAYCGNNPVNYCDPTGHAYQGIYAQINYNEHDHTYGGLRENFYALPDGVDFNLPEETIMVVGTSAAIIGLTVFAVATCGAGSIAGVAMISATATFSAKAAEVGILQAQKSGAEGKNGAQVVEDVFGSIYDNGAKIIGLTPVTKSAGIGFNHYLHATVENAFGGKQTIYMTLTLKGGKVVPYAFAAIAWGGNCGLCNQ